MKKKMPKTIDEALEIGSKDLNHEKSWWNWRLNGAGKLIGASCIGAIAVALGWTAIEDRELPKSDVIWHIQKTFPSAGIVNIRVLDLEGRLIEKRSLIEQICKWESWGTKSFSEIAQCVRDLEAKPEAERSIC